LLALNTHISKSPMTDDPCDEEEDDICDICMNTNTQPVKCPKGCKLAACADCVGRFLCLSKEDPHCMQCKRGWSAAEIATSGLPLDFVAKTMRPAREQVLWEREQALLPATQALAQAVRDSETAGDDEAFLRAKARIRRLEAGLPPDAVGDNGVVQRCPSCPGFILATNFQCGLCKTALCRRCREVVSGDEGKGKAHHACNPAALASVAALVADTRPCPSCATAIYRMYGCDQMFCTMCHTAFSWSKGAIDTGSVHNPHFFDAQRSQVAAKVGAADLAAASQSLTVHLGATYSQFEQDLPPFSGLVGSRFMALRRLIVDLRATGKTSRPRRDNSMLRASLLLGRVTEKEFKRRLFVGERARLRQSDQALVLDTFCAQAAALLCALCAAPTTAEVKRSLERQLELARVTCNEQLRGVCAYAGGKAPAITEDMSELLRA
jgi:hypothetical protein